MQFTHNCPKEINLDVSCVSKDVGELNREKLRTISTGECHFRVRTKYNKGPTREMITDIVNKDQEMSVVLVNWIMKFIQGWSEQLPGFLKHLYVDEYPTLFCFETRDADFFTDDDFEIFIGARSWEWNDGLRLLWYSKILIPICGSEGSWSLVLVDIPRRSLRHYSPGIGQSEVDGIAVLSKVKRWIDEEAVSVCNKLREIGEDDIAGYVTEVRHSKWSTSNIQQENTCTITQRSNLVCVNRHAGEGGQRKNWEEMIRTWWTISRAQF